MAEICFVTLRAEANLAQSWSMAYFLYPLGYLNPLWACALGLWVMPGQLPSVIHGHTRVKIPNLQTWELNQRVVAPKFVHGGSFPRQHLCDVRWRWRDSRGNVNSLLAARIRGFWKHSPGSPRSFWSTSLCRMYALKKCQARKHADEQEMISDNKVTEGNAPSWDDFLSLVTRNWVHGLVVSQVMEKERGKALQSLGSLSDQNLSPSIIIVVAVFPTDEDGDPSSRSSSRGPTRHFGGILRWKPRDWDGQPRAHRDGAHQNVAGRGALHSSTTTGYQWLPRKQTSSMDWWVLFRLLNTGIGGLNLDQPTDPVIAASNLPIGIFRFGVTMALRLI